MYRLALTVAAALGLSACFIADEGISGITLRNDTERSLWIDADPANEQSRRFKAEPHDLSTLMTNECTDQRVEAQSRSGRVIAVLDRTWCPGQLWSINSQGEFVLAESP